jgi:hypothetical protein
MHAFLYDLQEYQHMIAEAKKRDHRLLGLSHELFFFHPLRYLSISYLNFLLFISLLQIFVYQTAFRIAL